MSHNGGLKHMRNFDVVEKKLLFLHGKWLTNIYVNEITTPVMVFRVTYYSKLHEGITIY